MKLRISFIIFFLFAISLFLPAQKLAIGGGGIYNIDNNSVGYDLRLHWQIFQRLAIVPKYNRFPSFNNIFERYIGLEIDFTLFLGLPQVYVLVSAEDDKWFNYGEYDKRPAVSSAFTEELGLGLRFSKKCLQPYVEGRYNFFWQEVNARAGILIFFIGCNSGKKRGGRRKTCPAYLD